MQTRPAFRPLMFVSWISMAIFGLYILVFYGAAVVHGTMERDWNEVLPRLYLDSAGMANLLIGLHFLAGTVMLLLGPLQMMASLRQRWPRLHHWNGRIYLSAAALAGVGGLLYLLLRGAVGGPVMTLGFGIYGALMLLAAAQTYRHARARDLPRHRAWAIRLFTLGLGSWLYRMEYGLWLQAFHGPGHVADLFNGPFDMVMDFFYVPHLLVAEWLIRHPLRPALNRTIAAIIGAVALAAVTYLFAVAYWVPHMRGQLG